MGLGGCRMIMKIVEWLVSHLLEILVIMFLIHFASLGHKMGTNKSLVYLFQFIIAIALAAYIAPNMVKILTDITDIDKFVKGNFLGKIDGYSNISSNATREQAEMLINGLGVPNTVKTAILKYKDVQSIWNGIGVSNTSDYIAFFLSNIIINIFSFLIWFVAVAFAIKIVVKKYDWMSKIPEDRGVGPLLGVGVFIFVGLMFLWLACLLIYALSGITIGHAILDKINSSPILGTIYKTNFVEYLIKYSIYELY